MPTLFGVPRALLGMLHLHALPGTPADREAGLHDVVRSAVEEARRYRDAGFHGLLIENMHDVPYLRGAVGAEIVAAMAVVGREVLRDVPLPLGVQVLAGANREAVAVALACGASFVRVEGFVFAHVADEGLLQGCAGELLRYRRTIGAEHVRILADVKKKHASHALTADIDLVATARAAEFFRADAVVVTGSATGQPAEPAEVRAVSEAVSVPTVVGSGVDADNVAAYAAADALIVGSSVKVDGLWSNPLDARRLDSLVRAFEGGPRRR